ncbi:hypothetical protein SAMN05444161_5562 [Rhizobiales bacterium GAS191]|nr:hypothetical protein SAMN05444161_5562 [Rhizobiales bacterium GAS191]
MPKINAARPATAVTVNGPRKVESLGRWLNFEATPSANEFQEFPSLPLAARESYAFRRLPNNARRVLDVFDRQYAEDRRANGRLWSPYPELAKAARVRKASLPLAIRQCVTFGFLRITRPGDVTLSLDRLATHYALTYAPIGDAAPTDEWRNVCPDDALTEAEMIKSREHTLRYRRRTDTQANNSLSDIKPWLAEGISRRTWYRRKERRNLSRFTLAPSR